MAPGLGKTLTTLTAFERRKKKEPHLKMLIVAKLRICHMVWPKEIKKWGFDYTCSVLHGNKKDKLFEDDADIHLVNYEALKWLAPKLKGANRGKYQWCTLDESSKIKNSAAKRSKMLHNLAPQFDYRLILTGSPTPKSLLDIFSQIKFLDFGYRLGRYITKFRNEYFYPTGYMGYDWQPFDNTEERITAKLKDIVIRVSHEEAGIELPKENAVIRRVQLPTKAKKIYDELEKDYVAQVEDETITAASAAVATNKLRQVANGGIFNAEHVAQSIHDEKTEELIEIVEELQGSPVLVAYEYQHDLERLLEAFPDAPHIGGGVKTAESLKIEADWNAGKIPVLLGQPDSIAHGLNLQDGGCHTVVFYALTWNLENYEQFIQRVLRQGNKAEFVTVIHIVAEGTVDEDVLVSLYAKDQTQQTFLNSLEERLGVNFKKVRGEKMDKYKVLHKHIPHPLGPCYSGKPEDMQWLREASNDTFRHNFVNGLLDRVKSWLPKQHVAFLKDMGVKKVKDTEPLRKLYDRSQLMVEEILGAFVNGGGFYELKDKEVIVKVLKVYNKLKKGSNPMVKESRITDEIETNEKVVEGEIISKKRNKSKEHFDKQVAAQKKAGAKKSNGKDTSKSNPKSKTTAKKKAPAKSKAVTKKSAPSKSATSKSSSRKTTPKAVAKKSAGRKPKTEIKYRASNLVKVTSEDFPRAAFRVDVLKLIRRARNKKLGNIMESIQAKLGVTESKAFKALEGLRDQGYINFK